MAVGMGRRAETELRGKPTPRLPGGAAAASAISVS
jgi:hypothetical protein